MKKKLLATLVIFGCLLSQANFASAASTNPFSDTNAAEVKFLYDKKIIGGYGDGTFKPNNPITRAEALVIVENAMDIHMESSTVTNFTDVPVSHWAYASIQTGVEHKLLNGYGNGTFQPNKKITRAESSALISRANKLTTTSVVKYLDVPKSHPFYTDINKMTSAGFFSGTSFSLFSPDREITRGEFAVVVARTLNPAYRVKFVNPKIVQIDAGHGAQDPGGVSNGLQEKNLVLDVSLRIQKKLQAKGVAVLMSRTTDTFLKLEDRAKLSADYQVDAFVSVHSNAATTSQAKGVETYYKTGDAKSQQLASLIQNSLVKSTQSTDRGAKPANYKVLKENEKPASLVEIGFITNEAEAAKLKTSAYRDTVASAIAGGIVSFLNAN